MSASPTPPDRLDVLRAIAHPARIRLYELLAHEGPATVSRLATRSSLAIGSVSYHLQQLRAVGFVRDALHPPADRREHWWEATPGGLSWSPADFLDSPGGSKASSEAQRVLYERRISRLAHWLQTWDQWEREWIEAATESDAMLKLTPQELTAFASELQAVIGRWRAKGANGSAEGDATGERKSVFMFVSAFPVTEEAP